MRMMSLDISLNTGYAVTMDARHNCQVTSGLIKGGSLRKGSGVCARFDRIGDMIVELEILITTHDPELVLVEGYAYGVKRVSFDSIEVNAVMRHFLWSCGLTVVEVSPSMVKKFVSGKGNCKKDLILKEVYRRWDFDTDDDNIADAYGILQLGRAVLGYEEFTKAQEPAVTQLEADPVISKIRQR